MHWSNVAVPGPETPYPDTEDDDPTLDCHGLSVDTNKTQGREVEELQERNNPASCDTTFYAVQRGEGIEMTFGLSIADRSKKRTSASKSTVYVQPPATAHASTSSELTLTRVPNGSSMPTGIVKRAKRKPISARDISSHKVGTVREKHRPLSLAPSEASDDELYRVTPDLPRARLATTPAQQDQAIQNRRRKIEQDFEQTLPDPQQQRAAPEMSISENGGPPAQAASPSSSVGLMLYDPVREAAGQPQRQQPGAMEASFYSAVSSAPSPASSRTMNHEATPQLIDVSEEHTETHTPMSPLSFGFQTDTESDSDTFASMSNTPSRSHSRHRSEVSNVELLDPVEDIDIDML